MIQTFDDFLQALTAFEAGGSGLAFAPINAFDEIPAVASTVGGSLTAVDWFKTAIAELDSAILFLVGAPGNGKSYLVKKVTSGLIQLGDHLSDRRKFEYAVPNKTELIVINDAKAKRLRDANDTTGNTAFNTQPGKIPGRARMNAASERSFRMNEKAQQQRTRAENLQRMATTNKGDAAKGRAARAEQVKASYGGIKKGTMVESIMGGGGAATVIRANAKSVTMKMSDGRVMNQPYEALKLKPATLGSSKVVDSAKVNRMAGRLGAKARAPKSSSPVKNANTVATRAKAVAFLVGKNKTSSSKAAASESMAANIRNRQVFSTGKKAAPKAAKAPKGGMRATKRVPLAPDSASANRLAMFKSGKQLTDQRTKSLRAGLKKETDPVQKIKTSSSISESQLKSKSYGDDITRMQARPIMGKRTGIGRGDKPVLGPAAKRPNTIKGKPKRDAGVAAKVKPGINLNAKKYPAIYRDRANTKGKAAAKAAKRPMR